MSEMSVKKKFGEILIEKKVITTAQLEKALQRQRELNLMIGETLIQIKFVTESLLMEALGKELGVEYMNIADGDYQMIDRSLKPIIPLGICQRFLVLPLFHYAEGDVKEITIAMAKPQDEEAIKEVAGVTNCEVTTVLAPSWAVLAGIRKLFNIKEESEAKLNYTGAGDDATSLINKLLHEAVACGASDIHIEPHAREVHIRMRIDGVLQLEMSYPSTLHNSVVSRVKIMGSGLKSLMKIDERRLPQDGVLSRVVAGHSIDCRLSTLPTIYGEKVVMRVFDRDKETHVGRIADLKLAPRLDLELRRSVRESSGVMVITGPTGSGKTTTLHAIVNEINDVSINIITIEDPVEYVSPDYTNQSSLNMQAGYTYTRALRAMMRQDPDVILIGEIRDKETAEIAVQAALTGHKVYSTLHTEDAAGAIMRMVDIGVEDFLVSSTLVSAVNQRLVRKICPGCMEDYVPTVVEMIDTGIDKSLAGEIIAKAAKYTMRRGRGCQACRNTGYRGRQGAFEMLTVTPEVRKMILEKQTSDSIAERKREHDRMNMMFEDGIRLFLTGVTTLGELQNLPRGDFKLKTVDNILRDAEV